MDARKHQQAMVPQALDVHEQQPLQQQVEEPAVVEEAHDGEHGDVKEEEDEAPAVVEEAHDGERGDVKEEEKLAVVEKSEDGESDDVEEEEEDDDDDSSDEDHDEEGDSVDKDSDEDSEYEEEEEELVAWQPPSSVMADQEKLSVNEQQPLEQQMEEPAVVEEAQDSSERAIVRVRKFEGSTMLAEVDRTEDNGVAGRTRQRKVRKLQNSHLDHGKDPKGTFSDPIDL